MKKILSLLTAAVISAAMLTACGGGKMPAETLSARTVYVYKAASAQAEGEVRGSFESFEYHDGKLYFISEYTPDSDSGYTEFYLNTCDTDGRLSPPLLLAKGEGIWLTPMRFAADGTGYCIEKSSGDDGFIFSLISMDRGGEISRKDITEIINENTDELYPRMLFIEGDILYIGGSDRIIALKTDGSYMGKVEDIYYINSLFTDKNGKPYVYLWNGGGYELRGVDLSAGSIGSSEDIPFEGYSNVFFKGSGCDFIVSDGTALYSYDLGGEKTELLNWLASGVSTMEVTDIFTEGEKIICAGKSFPYGSPKISVLTKQAKSNNAKKEITVAGSEYSIDGYIENCAVRFNAANDDYFVTVKKYPPDEQRLTTDILSGKCPDVLISSSYMPADKYFAKGIFADMYELMDGDGEISRSDFPENLLKACETDGKLYRFTDRFCLYTLLGKTSVFGEKRGITREELSKIAASKPAGTETIPGCSKADIIGLAMEYSCGRFIDREKGRCDFDNGEFAGLLKFADNFMDSSEADRYFDDSFWDSYETLFSGERALLMPVQLSDFSDIYRLEHKEFGERVTAVGFPNDSGRSVSFMTGSGFSVSERSAVKEGAWQFVRSMLLPEYQDCVTDLPVRKDSLQKAADAAMKHDPDKMNNATIMMGQMCFTASVNNIGEPNAEDIERFMDLISAAQGLISYDDNVTAIINEESAAFFSGTRSAEEAAKLIQMRVQLYLDEQG